jgi:hypothetical protein
MFELRLVRVEMFAVTRFEVTKLAELIFAVKTPRVVTFPVAVLLVKTLRVETFAAKTPRVDTFAVVKLELAKFATDETLIVVE